MRFRVRKRPVTGASGLRRDNLRMVQIRDLKVVSVGKRQMQSPRNVA